MDGNFIAEVLAAQDNINLCLQANSSSNNPNISSSSTFNSTFANHDLKISDAPNQTLLPQAPVYENEIDSLSIHLVTVSGVVLKEINRGMLLSPSKFVEYAITCTRLSDGSAHTIHHRFKDIKAFYYNLISEREEIDFNKNIKFPIYDDSWFSGGSKQSNDPQSELVQRRIKDLQVFFYTLFKEYPRLFLLPSVRSFLQMKDDDNKAISSFSLHLMTESVARPPTDRGQQSSAAPLDNGSAYGDASLAVAAQSVTVSSNFAAVDDGRWIYDSRRGCLVDSQTSSQSLEKDQKSKLTLVEILAFKDWMNP